MKKMFVLSMLISFAMICSCQKQDSAAEQQLAQRKAELDARAQALNDREQGLIEREEALNQRDRVLAEKEKATTNAPTILPGVQSQIPDPAQVEAERDSSIQQPPADVQALTADPSQRDSAKDEKDRLTQQRRAQRQRKLEATQKWRMSGAAVSPAAEATSPTPPPAIDATSPTPP
jgi:uncharacterized protein (DUF3084 family)